MLACRPAETVTADSQLQSIGSPGVVQFAPEFRDVPWKASGTALSDGLCAPVRLSRVLHALLVGSFLKMANTRTTCQSNCPSVHPAGLCRPSFKSGTFSAFGHGAELPDDLGASVNVAPRSAVVVRVPKI